MSRRELVRGSPAGALEGETGDAIKLGTQEIDTGGNEQSNFAQVQTNAGAGPLGGCCIAEHDAAQRGQDQPGGRHQAQKELAPQFRFGFNMLGGH